MKRSASALISTRCARSRLTRPLKCSGKRVANRPATSGGRTPTQQQQQQQAGCTNAFVLHASRGFSTSSAAHDVSLPVNALKRVHIVRKMSVYERLDPSKAETSIVSAVENIKKAHVENKQSTIFVQEALQRRNIETRLTSDGPSEEDLKWCDMVVVLGGDGTFLRATRSMADSAEGVAKPVLVVNSVPSSSFGHFAAANAQTFGRLLDLLLSGKALVRPLWRCRIGINGVWLRNLTALNDLLLAGSLPSATARYDLRVADHTEHHKSSGVWVATPSGSSGAILSAGGKRRPLHNRELQFQVRELFRGHAWGRHGEITAKEHTYMESGLTDRDGMLAITSLMRDACVYVDGTQHMECLRYHDTVNFDNSDYALSWVAPDAETAPWLEERELEFREYSAAHPQASWTRSSPEEHDDAPDVL